MTPLEQPELAQPTSTEYAKDYGVAHRKAKRDFRTEFWTTKGGTEVALSCMDDRYIFNAYRVSQDPMLFREMVLRLFESQLKEKNT
jgi:hypothetical protein